jgi:nitrite reductase (NADH) large subunit
MSGRDPAGLTLAPEAWYRDRGIRLVLGDAVAAVDPALRRVRTRSGREFPYDRLVLATGSRAFVPPVPGVDLPGVHVYRTLADLEAIRARARPGCPALVAGGGLLGLEAARALLDRNMRVTVAENSLRLLSRQLNPRAADLVRLRLADMGMDIRLQTGLASIEASGGGSLRLGLTDGARLDAWLVVIAAGARPRDELAAGCGLALGPRGGFAVDDRLRTSLPDVYAVGECASHRGRLYGLAAPGFRMAEALAATLRGKERSFTGADQSTTLKVLGLEVHVLGEPLAEGSAVVQEIGGAYRELTLREGRLVGAVAVGPWDEVEFARETAVRQARLRRGQVRRFARGGPLRAPSAGADPAHWAPGAVICHCNRIDKRTICAAIASGCAGAEAVRKATGAASVCGGCLPVVEKLLGMPPSAPPSRALPVLACAGALAWAFLALLPPLPVSPTVQSPWHRAEILWRNSAWHQATGYGVLGLCALSLLFPLRKRLASARRFGSLPAARLLHMALALGAAAALAAHTGLRWGHGLNLALSLCFLALNLLGAGASAALSLLERRPGAAAAGLRFGLAWAHVLLFWPLPILILFHVWAVYRF